MSNFQDNFTPSDFHALSSEIENSIRNQIPMQINSFDAAWLRAAISRTYYSAYLAIREEFLGSVRLQTRISHRSRDHITIKNELQRLPTHLVYLSQFFEDLRDYRNEADYDLPPNYEVDPSRVQLANLKAAKILQELPIIMQHL